MGPMDDVLIFPLKSQFHHSFIIIVPPAIAVRQPNRANLVRRQSQPIDAHRQTITAEAIRGKTYAFPKRASDYRSWFTGVF